MTLTFPIRSDKLTMSVAVSAHLASVTSPFQQIDVYETDVFGRVLTLDGHIQLTSFDEAAYHEAMVHVPMANLVRPIAALVVGGGDGGVIREMCRYDSLERVDMVEIDAAVVSVCREHLPEVSGGAFDDPRVHLHTGDAFEFVKNSTRSYDLIVVDCTDVYEEEEGELSERLFTDQFYRDVRSRLSADGIVVTQADNPVFCPYSLSEVMDLYGRVFTRTGSYWALVPSFGGFSAFCWGCQGAGLKTTVEPGRLPARLSYLDEKSYAMSFSPLPWPIPQ